MMATLLRRVAGRPVAAPLAMPEGVEVVAGRWIPQLGGWLAGMKGSAAAVTLGRTIVVHPEARVTERLLRHELAHVRQWQRHPVLFPVLYTAAFLRHGYRSNPFEVEARAAEDETAAAPDPSRSMS